MKRAKVFLSIAAAALFTLALTGACGDPDLELGQKQAAVGEKNPNRIGIGEIQAMVQSGFTGQDAHATHDNGGYVHGAAANFSKAEINFFNDGKKYCSQDYLALHIGWGYFDNTDGTSPSVPEQLEEFRCLDIRWRLKKPGENWSPIADNDGQAKVIVETVIGNPWGSWHGMVKPSWHIFAAGELAAGTYWTSVSLYDVCEDLELIPPIPSSFVVVDSGPVCD